jgi:hypothetical protein
MANGASLIGRVAMQTKLRLARTVYPDRVGKALYDEMGIEEKEVVKRTPKKTGKLRSTIHRIGPSQEGQTTSVLIVAGGPEAPHAPIVHEDLEAIHPIGQAKFLESVILESRGFIAARVARRIRISDWVD